MRIRSIASSVPTRRVSSEEIVERVRQASASYLPPGQMKQVIKRLRILFRLAGSGDRYERGRGERSGDFVLRAAREALACRTRSTISSPLTRRVGTLEAILRILTGGPPTKSSGVAPHRGATLRPWERSPCRHPAGNLPITIRAPG